DSRYRPVKQSTAGRSIESMTVNNDGDLIINYDDGTSQNAGRLPSGTPNLSVTERLVVSSTNVLSLPNNTIDVTKPATLVINHLTYTSVDVPPAFTMSANSLTWSPETGGLDITETDIVSFHYSRVAS